MLSKKNTVIINSVDQNQTFFDGIAHYQLFLNNFGLPYYNKNNQIFFILSPTLRFCQQDQHWFLVDECDCVVQVSERTPSDFFSTTLPFSGLPPSPPKLGNNSIFPARNLSNFLSIWKVMYDAAPLHFLFLVFVVFLLGWSLGAFLLVGVLKLFYFYFFGL